MRRKVSDQDVLKLLTNLKSSESSYPSDMINSRRDSFAKQVAAMAVLVRAGMYEASTTGNSQAVTASGTAGTTTTASVGTSLGTILETILVAAIVVEAGVAAYVYRDKITDFINSKINPTVEAVASPPGSFPPDILTEDAASTDTPVATETIAGTETPVPSITLPPVVDDPSNNDTGGSPQIGSTPEPTKPGLHLGQTKQPTQDPKQNDPDPKNKEKDK